MSTVAPSRHLSVHRADLINHYIAERDDSFAIKHRLQESALFLVPLAAASQQACPHYPSQWAVHAPTQILMIKEGCADKIGMIKKKIALTTNLYVDDVSVFARCTREIAKRITIKRRVSEQWVSRSWQLRRATIDSLDF